MDMHKEILQVDRTFEVKQAAVEAKGKVEAEPDP